MISLQNVVCVDVCAAKWGEGCRWWSKKMGGGRMILSTPTPLKEFLTPSLMKLIHLEKVMEKFKTLTELKKYLQIFNCLQFSFFLFYEL